MSDAGYAGSATPDGFEVEYNRLAFLITSLIEKAATLQLVQVKSVTGGGLGTPAIVSIQPMVHQIDGQGRTTPHGVIYGVPVFRLQGGANAVIVDPQVGDIGLAACCLSDISTVKTTKQPSPPGSFRRQDWADALYLGGFLNGVPAQYISVSGSGIVLGAGMTMTTGDFAVATGASGTFTTPTGQTVTVQDGIVTNIF
jgi:hypothetical protein